MKSVMAARYCKQLFIVCIIILVTFLLYAWRADLTIAQVSLFVKVSTREAALVLFTSCFQQIFAYSSVLMTALL